MPLTLSSVRRRGLRGEKEEEAGGRKRAGSTGTATSGADAHTRPTRSGVSAARNRVLIHSRNKRDYGLVLSPHDKNGGNYKKKNEVVKEYFCGA